MGFLNHATNNIIIDAVLTERGRELLSKNDGSFNISSFNFGDDEIDYSIITKYGNPIGKEKIEKNTPIFEANPNENIAIKYPLISFPNPLKRITEMPVLVRTDASGDVILYDSTGSNNTNPVSVDIVVQNSVSISKVIDENLTDSFFYVKMHGDLLALDTSSGTKIETDINNIDTYTVDTKDISSNNITNQKNALIKVYSNDVVSAAAFGEFHAVGNPNKINTSIQIIGASSGATLVIPVQINKATTT